jgi:CRISPR-associated protein Cas1
MKRNYYLFNPGRMSRKDNTLKFVTENETGSPINTRRIPVEAVKSLYVFGSVDANSATYNFLGKQKIPVHFFDYYEHYTGSFHPKEYLLAGKMQLEQTKTHVSKKKRQYIAIAILDAAMHNMMKNIKYYHTRGKEMPEIIQKLNHYREQIHQTTSIPELMGLEGNFRQVYYSAFDIILDHFQMNGRSKRPPKNEVNALMSFGNMMCYTLCLDQVYHTQLNPTISYLHEPGTRRYSLCLDLAEIFKPLIVDRLIFRTLNRKEIKASHFDQRMNGITLKDNARKTFIQLFNDRANETIMHRTLNKKVSYKHLIKLECYKLSKYILGIEKEYKPLKMWW